jgi:gamma-glutamyltranspeptidase/glutathione hydrolase
MPALAGRTGAQKNIGRLLATSRYVSAGSFTIGPGTMREYDQIAEWSMNDRGRNVVGVAEALAVAATLPPRACILDVGCGNGVPITQALVNASNRVIGLDTSAGMLAFFRINLAGTRVIAKGTGFLLNDEMHDFNMNPGVTDTRGLIGTNPNLIQPGKRMLSSMSPLIVLKDKKPFLVTGSPGGRTIINTVLQVIVNVIDFKMDVQAAVGEPRIHHQWLPDVITLERPLEPIVPSLNAIGDQTRLSSTQGDSHSILIKDAQKYVGVDHRVRGGAAGY